MSNKQNLLQQVVKLKYDAATKKPQTPRWGEEAALNKSLMDMQEQYSRPDREVNNQMLDEISQQNQTKGGGSFGDAFITGLKSGIKKGSFLDDKKRLKGIMDFTEKMQGMVSTQNQELWQQEKQFNAKQAIAPRIYGYLESYQNMTPNDRKVYLDNVLREFNQKAGTSYELLDTGGSDPVKVLVDTGNGAEYLDLMDLVQTDEQKKLDLILKGQEFQQLQRSAEAQDSLDSQLKQAQINRYNGKGKPGQDPAISQKKQMLIESGIMPENGILLDEISDHRVRKMREEELMERASNLDPMVKGLKNLDQMQEIISKNKGLYKDFARIVELSDEKNPSILNSFYKGFKSKEISEVQKLSKLANDLIVNEIKAFPGRPTDLVKKTIIKTIADAGNTPESFALVKQNLSDQYLKVAQDARQAANYRKYGVYAPQDVSQQSEYLDQYVANRNSQGNQENMGTQPSSGTIILQSPNGVKRVIQDTPENREKVKDAVNNRGYKLLNG